MRIKVLDIYFDNIIMSEAVDAAISLMKGERGARVVTPNPEIVWECMSNYELRDIINSSQIVLPDGIGIILGAKILGTPLRAKVPGIDFACELMGTMARRKMSVFLLGAKPAVAEKAGQYLSRTYPGLCVAGCIDGYFDDAGFVCDRVAAAKPDLLLVCLGSPYQEQFMSQYGGRLDTGLMIGLGGSLDVLAGQVKRAPESWRRLGLEWLYRLISDPKRIKRMIRLPLFLFEVIIRAIRGKNDAS